MWTSQAAAKAAEEAAARLLQEEQAAAESAQRARQRDRERKACHKTAQAGGLLSCLSLRDIACLARAAADVGVRREQEGLTKCRLLL